LCMEVINEVVINTSEVQPKVWKGYVAMWIQLLYHQKECCQLLSYYT